MAEKLSSNFPFVRVDFYEINGRAVFGGMTFTPGMDVISYEFSKILGEKIALENTYKNLAI